MRRSPRAGLYNLITVIFVLLTIGVIVFVLTRFIG